MKCYCCRFCSIRNKKDDGISIKEVRQTLYSRYEAEVKNLWDHSILVWGFEILLFTGYAFIVANCFLKKECDNLSLFYPGLCSVALSFIGICTASIWIALAKSAKTWQEMFEAQITELESNPKFFNLPYKLAMGGFHFKLKDLDQKLYTTNIGRFSPGRLNIFIGQFIWLVWCSIGIVHCLIIENSHYPNCNILLLLVFCSLYMVFLFFLKKRCNSNYIQKEDYGNDYIFELIQKINRVEKHLDKIKKDKESLCYFFCNSYFSLNWGLFKIFQTHLYLTYEEWEEERFLELFQQFKSDYVKGNLKDCSDVEGPFDKYKSLINETLKFYKEEISKFYV